MIGRKAKGRYLTADPAYEAKDNVAGWVWKSATGEVAGYGGKCEYSSDPAVWILDDEGRIQLCRWNTVTIYPREYAGPLR